MIKKFILVFTGFAITAAFPLGALAQNTDIIAKPILYPNPQPPILLVDVTPRNPFDLFSCGKLEVKGRGTARVEDFNGSVEVSVNGRLAVKEEDLGSVKISGFNQKHRRGVYIVFKGRGSLSGNGSDLDLVVLGKGKVESKGCGETHLRGHWQGSFQRFWRVIPLPEPYPWPRPLPLPVELQEFESEALAG